MLPPVISLPCEDASLPCSEDHWWYFPASRNAWSLTEVPPSARLISSPYQPAPSANLRPRDWNKINNGNWNDWGAIWCKIVCVISNFESQVWFQTKIERHEVQLPLYFSYFEIAEFIQYQYFIVQVAGLHRILYPKQKRCDIEQKGNMNYVACAQTKLNSG